MNIVTYFRNAACKIQFHVDPADIVIAGLTIMCRYLMSIPRCSAVGGVGTCKQYGMLQCRCDGVTGKIVAVELIYDVMGFMQQLQTCWGISPENSIAPNTLDSALQVSREVSITFLIAC